MLRGMHPGIDLATTDPTPVQLDGDEFGEARQVTTRVVAGGLLLAMPAGHNVASL